MLSWLYPYSPTIPNHFCKHRCGFASSSCSHNSQQLPLTSNPPRQCWHQMKGFYWKWMEWTSSKWKWTYWNSCWNPSRGTFALDSFFGREDFFILTQPHDTPGSQRQCDISRVAGQSWGDVRPTPDFGGLGYGYKWRPIICLNTTRLLIKLANVHIFLPWHLTNITKLKYKKTYSFYMIKDSKISKTTGYNIMNI